MVSVDFYTVIVPSFILLSTFVSPTKILLKLTRVRLVVRL